MRPGQVELNDFESAILRWMARERPALLSALRDLRVLSRTFTGVGSFTKFKSLDSRGHEQSSQISLDGRIRMPGVPNGMGAVLFLDRDQPKILETFAYGDEHWDGVFEGFAIEP